MTLRETVHFSLLGIFMGRGTSSSRRQRDSRAPGTSAQISAVDARQLRNTGAVSDHAPDESDLEVIDLQDVAPPPRPTAAGHDVAPGSTPLGA